MLRRCNAGTPGLSGDANVLICGSSGEAEEEKGTFRKTRLIMRKSRLDKKNIRAMKLELCTF